MVRASVPGGAVSAPQWSAMDRLADDVADGSLRLTSRGGVQFHFTRKGGLAPLIRTLDSHLVTTLAACGDVVRNIVACPAPLADSRQKVLLDLAQRLAVRFRPTHRRLLRGLDRRRAALSAPRRRPRRPIRRVDRCTAPRTSPEVQDRPGLAGRQLHRHLQPRSGPRAGGRRRRSRRLRRPRRRRARGQPRPARRHLPAPRRPARLGPRRRRRGRRRGRRPRLPRPRQPGGPQAGPAQVRASRSIGLDAFRAEVEQRLGARLAPRPSCRRGTSTTTWAGTARTTAGGSSACPCPAGGWPASFVPPWPRSSSGTSSTCGSPLDRTCC